VYIRKYPPPPVYHPKPIRGGKYAKWKRKKEENVKEKGVKTKYYGKNEVKRVQ
jgi:hypothetical protein